VVKTYIVYRYRDPESSEELEVRTETLDYEPQQALNLVHPVGMVFPLWSDHPERDGAQPTERRVAERYFDPEIQNQLIVIVTDLDA
jgi:hypothetical protein